MECQEARENLLEYREGQLDLEGRMHLEAHLLICAGCREECRALDALLSAIAALPLPDPSPGFAGRLRARIEGDKRRHRFPWLPACRFTPAWAAAVLALVLGTGAALWAVRQGTIPPRRGMEHARTAGEDAARTPPLGDAARTAHVLLGLWPRGDPEGPMLPEGRDRSLLSLALGDGEVHVEEAVRIWTLVAPDRRARDGWAELRKLSEKELAVVLARLGTG